MPTTAKAPPAFDLRSSSVTLLLLVLRTASVEALRTELQARYGEAPSTFEDDLTLVDLSHLDAAAQIDVAALVAVLREVRLLPVAVRGGSAEQRAAALAVGLGDAGEGSEHPAVPLAREAVPVPPPAEAIMSAEADVPSASDAASVASPPDEATAPEPAAVPVTTLVIDKPLRSGQQVYARGGDLVVLAAVNYGAEVIADGNVHVYGPLRGKAIAGARGDTAARIFSTSLQPELLSIAGTYRTSENPLPTDVAGRAAQVRLDGERLVFEPLA